ncbi:MAG: stage II sporulation protein D [Oscillospiraceae bacterium]|nr:stage II sporulation protein D [Oscillospiraceae bacterium]
MKDFLKPTAVFTLLVIMIPMLAMFKQEPITAEEPYVSAETEERGEPLAHTNAYTNTHTNAAAFSNYEATAGQAPPIELLYRDEAFKVLDVGSGGVIDLSIEEYVIGAVLAEMPASFHTEALKAQAVAAHTYAVRQKEKQLISPDERLKGAYISNDSSKYQAYFTENSARAFYGELYDEYYEKVSSAVGEVIDMLLFYKGEPIVAAFHSMSGGITESAEVVWGSAIDYLIPVDSSRDKESPAFEEKKTFTAAELEARLTAEYSVTLPPTRSEWLNIKERSPSGTVISLTAGDKELTGAQFRTLLTLRSANFTISYDSRSGVFTIISKGYGHGVGLSQHGANFMAQDGKAFDEILMHYYPNAELIAVNSEQ